MATNELYCLDVSKIQKNPNMKPRRNPIHMDYVDKCDKVFNKFGISEQNYLGKGGHNIIYKTDTFTLRISKTVLSEANEPGNREIYISKSQKALDEKILQKAIKHGLSPRVYIFSNIEMKGHIHRYCILESYDTCLTKFIRQSKPGAILKMERCCYKSTDDIFQDIGNQLVELSNRILDMGIVYYDFKPDNVVVNIDKETGKLCLSMIDWDCELCGEERWIENNKDAITFLNLVICAFYMYHYFNCNILYSKVKELYTREKLDAIFDILCNEDNDYVTIIMHYFYLTFGMTLDDKERFDISHKYHADFMKKNMCNMIKYACKMYKVTPRL